MKNKIIYLVSVISAFFLGILVTYVTITKQQMDAVLQGDSTHKNQVSHRLANANKSENSPNSIETTNNVTQQNDQITDNIPNKIDDTNSTEQSLNINDYSENQAKQLIKDMPDVILGQYVDKFMAKDASNVIADKRRFAERAIEELYRANDSQLLSGSIKVSLNQKSPDDSANNSQNNSLDTSKVNKFAKLYAHLDTNGQVPSSPYTFIKWINNQTGQVLLFEKKDIVADRNQNWVSFIPDDGWQVGSYDVRFYQFTSELEPIAQTTYNIYEVVE